MQLYYTFMLMTHVAIRANSSIKCLDNILTDVLPDLVVMGFETNTAFAENYTENLYNFKNNKIKRMDLLRNGTQVSKFSYLPNFTKKHKKSRVNYVSRDARF